MTFDVDDKNGFGPENISVHQPIPGGYTASVQNFSDEAGLGTTVTLYIFKRASLDTIFTHTFLDGGPDPWQVVRAWRDED